MRWNRVIILAIAMVWGGFAGRVGGQGVIEEMIFVPTEKYAAFIVPDTFAELMLTLKADSGFTLLSSEIVPEDTCDTTLWAPTIVPHQYKSGWFTVSSREWLRVKGKVQRATAGGSGSSITALQEFDVDVPSVDIDLMDPELDEFLEESPGGFVGVGTNNMRKVTINKVQSERRFIGKVKLTVPSGGSKIKLWKEAGRINAITSGQEYTTPWGLPVDVWVEGIEASGALRDVELKASYTTPTENKTTEDKVKLTILKVEFKAEDGTSDPREYVDADTEVAPSYNTVKYKAVVTPSVSGAFTWSTTSSKITLADASCQTVTVNAGANGSSAVDAEVLKVDFTPTGSTTTCSDTHDLTVVHCTFTAYADNQGGLDPLVGHAWWQFGITPSDASDLIEPYYLRYYVNKQMGYYPVSMTIVVLPPWWSPGVLVIGPQGTHTPTAQHAWDIPFILLDNGLDYCSDLDDSPGIYHLWNYNCCHTTIGAAGSCSVSIPAENDRPTEMNDYLDGL